MAGLLFFSPVKAMTSSNVASSMSTLILIPQ
jgi:hypothetical protein